MTVRFALLLLLFVLVAGPGAALADIHDDNADRVLAAHKAGDIKALRVLANEVKVWRTADVLRARAERLSPDTRDSAMADRRANS